MDNRYGEYQKIRRDRTYRTIGKMSLWRVALGIALLIFVLLLSGAVSQMLASHGHFKAAQTLMISKQWMEKYKPETKAYIDAGVLYQAGDYEAAYEMFSGIEGLEAAEAMKSVTAVELARERLDAQDYDGAYQCITEADASLLPEDISLLCQAVCAELMEHYKSSPGDEYAKLSRILSEISEE